MQNVRVVSDEKDWTKRKKNFLVKIEYLETQGRD